jgi:hypothetical protein
MSPGEREQAQLESSLRRLPGVSRINIVATLSPKGGCGKDDEHLPRRQRPRQPPPAASARR